MVRDLLCPGIRDFNAPILMEFENSTIPFAHTLMTSLQGRNQHSEQDLLVSGLGGFELKTPRRLPANGENATIEVELAVAGHIRSMKGQGRFDQDVDLGKVFRILVADKPGDFELLIPESNWKGIFKLSTMPGCEFKVSLLNPSVCVN